MRFLLLISRYKDLQISVNEFLLPVEGIASRYSENLHRHNLYFYLYKRKFVRSRTYVLSVNKFHTETWKVVLWSYMLCTISGKESSKAIISQECLGLFFILHTYVPVSARAYQVYLVGEKLFWLFPSLFYWSFHFPLI